MNRKDACIEDLVLLLCSAYSLLTPEAKSRFRHFHGEVLAEVGRYLRNYPGSSAQDAAERLAVLARGGQHAN